MSRSSLRVLTYHRVAPIEAPATALPARVSATPDDFERQVRHLAKRYRVVSLHEVVAAGRNGGRLPDRAVLLTFDDATRDFGKVVWPVLSHYGLPATVFVPTAFPDNPDRVFWWDRVRHAMTRTERSSVNIPLLGTLDLGTAAARRASYRKVAARIKSTPHDAAMRIVDRLIVELSAGDAPRGDVLSWDELRALAAQGVCLASHTRSHAALTQLHPKDVVGELAGSIADLEARIGSVMPVLCYPFGLYSGAVARAARECGFGMAFTCLDGHNDFPLRDPFQMKRTEVTARTTPRLFAARLLRLVTYVDMWRHRHKYPVDLAAGDSAPAESAAPAPYLLRVAYIMSRFPKLSETFVLNEMSAMAELGAEVEVFPLLRERQAVTHPEAERWSRKARFHPFVSIPIMQANAYFLARSPATYIRALVEILRGTFGSWNFFVGALGIFPKSVRFAYEMQMLGVMHVHAHFATHPAVAALVVRRLTGIPFSFTAHGSDLHVDRRMLREKLEAAAFAITVSDFNREVMVRDCGESVRANVHVVHCGVDSRLFAPTDSRGGGAPFQFVCVASMEEVKGHRFLIEACGLLRDRGMSFRCHLVGDGPLQRDIEARIRSLDLTEEVVVHGGLPRASVARILAAADAAVLASHPTADGKREGIPVALMEAMASGLPVVASAISGIPELVENDVTGILVPSGEPTSLAEALARLAGDPELRARMGVAGRRKVIRDFDLDANAERVLLLIRASLALHDVEPARDTPVTRPGGMAPGSSVGSAADMSASDSVRIPAR